MSAVPVSILDLAGTELSDAQAAGTISLGTPGATGPAGPIVGCVGTRRANYPQGGCMNSNQSSSEQFMLYLKSLGGSEADVTGPSSMASDKDTVETIVSRMRTEKYAHGYNLVDPSILQASAQVLISRRDENKALHLPRHPQKGDYQLDIHRSGSDTTREIIPMKSLKEAKIWARERLDTVGAQAGGIYLSSPGSSGPGTGTLAANFEPSVGWLVRINTE
jgi:hypothetical protein